MRAAASAASIPGAPPAPPAAWPAPSLALLRALARYEELRDLYALAFTIVRADEAITGGERIYLAQLAHHLGIDAATASRLELSTSTAIDAS